MDLFMLKMDFHIGLPHTTGLLSLINISHCDLKKIIVIPALFLVIAFVSASSQENALASASCMDERLVQEHKLCRGNRILDFLICIQSFLSVLDALLLPGWYYGTAKLNQMLQKMDSSVFLPLFPSLIHVLQLSLLCWHWCLSGPAGKWFRSSGKLAP